MQHHLIRRFALIFALAVAATTVVFVHGSSAAPGYTVHWSTIVYCDKSQGDAQAGYQDSSFGSELHGFWDSERVSVNIEFPNGVVWRDFALPMPIAAAMFISRSPCRIRGPLDVIRSPRKASPASRWQPIISLCLAAIYLRRSAQ